MGTVTSLPKFFVNIVSMVLLCCVASDGVIPSSTTSINEPSTQPSNKLSTPDSIPGHEIKCNPLAGQPAGCKCRLSDNGNIIDLSKIEPVVPNRKPRYYTESPHKWYLAWSPCHDFSIFADQKLGPYDRPCIDVGVARFTNLSIHECYGYGRHSDSFINVLGRDKYNRIKLQVRFRNRTSSPTLKASILLVCDTGAAHSKLEYAGQDRDTGTQILKFYSKCCCENGCVHDPTPTNSPKTHGVWYIVGGSLGAVSLVVALVALRIVRRRPRVLGYPVAVVDEHGPPIRQPVENEHQPLI